MLSQEQMFALSVIWVGGWGFLFFHYPEALCRLFHRETTPKRLRLMRIMGAIGLILTLCSAAGEFIQGFFSK
jgi:hypothetical protein